MSKQFSEKLLNFLESGLVKVDQKNCQMDFELKGCKVFASANDIKRISKPLQSRFRKFFLQRYSEEQFLDVSKYYPNLLQALHDILALRSSRTRVIFGMLLRLGNWLGNQTVLVRSQKLFLQYPRIQNDSARWTL